MVYAITLISTDCLFLHPCFRVWILFEAAVCCNDNSSGTDNLIVVEVIGSECIDNENDDVQCATASSAPTALGATFTWEDMVNYVGQREQRHCVPDSIHFR